MWRYGTYGMRPTAWGIGFGVVELVIQVAFWAAIIYGVVMLVRGVHFGNRWGGEPESLEILKQRYAKGEITKKEFEVMKKDIS